jgi:hypothetical protein
VDVNNANKGNYKTKSSASITNTNFNHLFFDTGKSKGTISRGEQEMGNNAIMHTYDTTSKPIEDLKSLHGGSNPNNYITVN